jgi:hypothetical protein
MAGITMPKGITLPSLGITYPQRFPQVLGIADWATRGFENADLGIDGRQAMLGHDNSDFSNSFGSDDTPKARELSPSDELLIKYLGDMTDEELATLQEPTTEDLECGTFRPAFNIEVNVTVSAPPKADPPQAAEWLVAAFLPEKYREAMLGDLEEHFSNEIGKYGETRARYLYWARVFGNLRPLIWRAVVKLRPIALFEIARRYFTG